MDNIDERRTYIEKSLREYNIEDSRLVEDLLSLFTNDYKRSNTFECPNCQAVLQSGLEVKIRRVVRLGEKYTPKIAEEKKDQMTQEQKDFLELLKSTGVYKAYTDALDEMPAGYKPRFIEPHLVAIIQRGVPMKIEQNVKFRLWRTYEAQKVEAFGLGNIAVIVADGKIVSFMPSVLLKGERLASLTSTGMEITPTRNPVDAQIWIRSKYGYVVGKGAYFSEMQAKSKGAFANTGI